MVSVKSKRTSSFNSVFNRWFDRLTVSLVVDNYFQSRIGLVNGTKGQFSTKASSENYPFCTLVARCFRLLFVLSRPFAGASRLAGCALGLIRIMSKHKQGVWGVR